ncbi:MAG: 2-aminoadipate aminotransferase [Proteobacteria bacterium]|nr:2-aminoadipate aminotransferase [Pseudomonadota bacterium]
MDDFLYRSVGSNIAQAIGEGALKAGDRLPSVRSLCRERDLSLATAVAAYRWLEMEGYIEARPRSGYFVRARSAPLRPAKAPVQAAQARLVGVSARNMRLFETQRQPGVVQLGMAIPEPALFPAEILRRHLNQAALRDPELLTRYPADARGLPAFKNAVARRLAAAGTAVSPEEIVVTAGCAEAINLALRAVTRPGDTVLVEAPTYYGLLQMLETHGLKALEIPSDPFSGPSIAAIEAATREPGKVQAALLVPNFANPTGSLMAPADKSKLAALLAERDICIIEDDVYGDMSHSGERPPLIKRWDGAGQHIACGSFNKSLAPGFRIGWMAAGRYRQKIEGLKFESTNAAPPILQAALAAYLDGGGFDRHLARLREQLRRHTARMAQLVVDHFPPETRLSEPKGGFVLWVELAPGKNADEIADRALKQGVAIAPGSLFSLDDRFRHCMRLNCGQAIGPEIEAAIKTLGALARGVVRYSV